MTIIWNLFVVFFATLLGMLLMWPSLKRRAASKEELADRWRMLWIAGLICCVLGVVLVCFVGQARKEVETIEKADQEKQHQLQLNDVALKIQSMFAGQDTPSGDITHHLRKSGDEPYVGFTPYTIPSMSSSKEKEQARVNKLHREAVSGLSYSNSDGSLISSHAGKIIAIAHEEGFVLKTPDCLLNICKETERQYSW